MKRASFSTAAVAILLCAGLLITMAVSDIAHAAPALHTISGVDWTGHVIEASPALLALQRKLSDLTTQAEARRAEITDDTSPEAARALETAHAEILEQIEAVRTEIAEEETRIAATASEQRQTTTPPAPVDVAAEVQRQIVADRQRTAEIRDICRRSGLDETAAQRFIDEGTSVDVVRTTAWSQMVERSNARRIFAQAPSDRLDEDETRRNGMRDAIVARLAQAAGDRNAAPPDHARQYAGMALVEIAAECVGFRGHMRTSHQAWTVFEQAFRQRSGGMHTVADFPGIFTDAMNVRLLQRYEAAMPTYRLFAQRQTAADFRAHNAIRAGDFPALQPVNEAGEIKGGTFGESKEQYQVKPYGVRFNISRQMLINDQLGAIDQMLGSSGSRVSDWENGIAFAALTAGSGLGPVLLTDNKRVFHADHNNGDAGGAAISVASLGAGRAKMAKQTTLDGIKANFQPSILLCGPDTITVAEQLLLAVIQPDSPSNAVPASLRRLTPVSDAHLGDSPAWYLFADPAVAPCFVYAYLEGFEGPRLTSEDLFGVQGMAVKLEHDFGFAGIDFRGGYRNAGDGTS